MLAVWIGCAFALGSLVRLIGLPPLVGFLAAGFLLSGFGIESTPALEEISHVGVLMLLFTVGLKLRLRNLLQPEVWATAIAHLAISVVLFGAVIIAIADLPVAAIVTLAAALGFSSTVLAAKVLEGKRELRAFHGRVAIGILIVQDILAVGLLALNGDHSPSPYAILLFALPLLRPLIGRLLDVSGHHELLVLYGALLAIAIGGYGFERLGLSPELGALVLGTMLSDHRRANELGNALWSIKEFFLVGFFLSIGLSGLPSMQTFGFALLIALAIPLKALLFFVLLLGFRLRARTGFLTGLSLASFSEFGLIVVQLSVNNGVLGSEWLILVALVVALSFVIAAPVNFLAHPIWERTKHVLRRMQRDCAHPDGQPISLGSADTIVVGMGRVGTGAYDYMQQVAGHRVAGVDSDPGKIQQHLAEGRRVVYADAEDPGFWERLHLGSIRTIMLAMPDLEAKVLASKQLRGRGYSGFLAATHVFPEERNRILSAGCDATYNYFEEAGVGFAAHTHEAMQVAKT